ncbi:GTPase/DUF3482 domain-containing protein [Hahella sp. HN01]|uniref:GTPase/DUF3482 domain-containing protein n=1 Tax=Hahella sp. HN01 TaxID=2847262 RepID=UPI001C1EB1AD|nr:GTPase/DUF3482 domain-containing protein [Hahella sp. HN01]MBU6953615.1 GTPase/DUF3482 domain-containing protein [Hahella sp. HN01]
MDNATPSKARAGIGGDPISVAVVGHTNAGKTSLMRTLLRDLKFGVISNHPGATRHVEAGQILVNETPVITLFDTPGLEDSIELLEALEKLRPGQDNGLGRLRAFIQDLDRYPQFSQEAKVIRQLLQDELIFYVVDVREPVLGKYRDELKVLSFAARPVIPVLNFIAAPRSNLAQWREHLAALNLHAQVEFDTVAFNFEDEKRLYQKMQALMAARYDDLQQLIEERQKQWESQMDSAAQRIAALWTDVASFRLMTANEEAEIQTAAERMQEQVRKAESDCVADLLQIFRFADEDVTVAALPVRDGEWELDLFDPDNMKRMGVEAGSGAAAGAAVGVGVDLMAGGVTLGAAAALGALAGVVWQTGRRYREDLTAAIRKQRKLCVDESTLKVLWLRQQYLFEALQKRGHASQQPMALADGGSPELPGDWSRWLRKARGNPEWSSLRPGCDLDDQERVAFIKTIGSNLPGVLVKS